jgi:hypothetical protein
LAIDEAQAVTSVTSLLIGAGTNYAGLSLLWPSIEMASLE